MKAFRVCGVFVAILVCAARVFSATDYYIDSSRSSSGDGSEATPWKAYSDINWTTVSNALFSGHVNIYFSSRDTWTGAAAGAYTVNQSDIAGENRISLIGNEKYNTTDSGTAVWSSETTTNRAIINGGTSLYMPHGAGYVTIKGFSVVNPTYGGINLGPSSGGLPTTNVHNIIVQDCLVDTPTNNHGIWAGYAEAGCSNYTIRGNTIIGTPSEGIYMGHYNYASQTIRGVIVESNTVINCGTVGEGDIDIKPACYGAIVRYNTHYRTTGTTDGSSSGVVIGADFCEVYGNTFFGADTNSIGGWGNNIFINDAGSADAFGQAITSCKVYNNLLYSAGQNGIRVISGAYASDPKSISGLEIYNNTIYGNTNHGVRLQVNAGSTLSLVMSNNIMANNAGYDLYIDTATGLTMSADYNLYYRPSGNSWYRAGAITSFASWQALGYDANGVNSDPLFTDVTTTNFTLTASSPARNAGVAIGSVSVDKLGTVRPVGSAWDIGAFESTWEYIAKGPLDLTPTFNCISARAWFTNDDNGSALAAFIWKPTADSTWRTTWTNYIDRRATVNGNANTANSNQARISLFGMSPNTSYDVAVTWTDGDGGSGSVTNTVTTLSWYPPTGGSDVWVDDDAASEGAGTEGDPFKTITNAIAQTTAGDTIRVKSGIYVPFTLSVSGTAGAWRMLKGEPGELVLIDGTAERNILVSADYWKFTNVHFLQTTGSAVTVSANRHHHYFEHCGFSNISQFGNFTLDGQWPAGIVMRSGSSNLYVRDCDFLTTNNNNSVDGITIGGNENIVIISNRFHGNFRDSVGGGGATWNSGFRYNTDIAWNVVTNQIDDGLEIEGMNSNVRTFGNYITTGVGSAALGLAPTLVGPHYVLRNYLINSNRVVFKIDNTSLGPLWVWHNTGFSVGGSSHIFSGEGGGAQTKLLLARNNILKGSANMYWNVTATNDVDYGVLVTSGTFAAGFDPGNLSYSTLANWQSGTGYDANSISTDPSLQSDFTILGSSSAADIGLVIPNINSADSLWPYSGAGPDIGAFEFHAIGSSLSHIAAPGKVVPTYP